MGNNENEFDDGLKSVFVRDEFNNDLEFFIIDILEHEGVNYLLVIESEFADEEESEAIILKEVSQDGSDAIFVVVDDDAEFDMVAALFAENSDDYDMEY